VSVISMRFPVLSLFLVIQAFGPNFNYSMRYSVANAGLGSLVMYSRRIPRRYDSGDK
jgi:hypothetical protein